MTIDGLPSYSPLANDALYSVEVSNDVWLNLYETMMPDVPGTNGSPSSGQRYSNALSRGGIDVAGNHYHWSGAKMAGYFPVAIHSQAIGMDPGTFSRLQIAALRTARS